MEGFFARSAKLTMSANVLWKEDECRTAGQHEGTRDSLYAGPHQLSETLQCPNDVVHLTYTLLCILSARTEVQSRSIVNVIAPDDHLACDSLRSMSIPYLHRRAASTIPQVRRAKQ